MRIKSHYVILVYPFFHRVFGPDRAASLFETQGRWPLWWNRLAEDSQNQSRPSGRSNANLERAIDDTYFFLPHIRQLLFPEVDLLPRGESLEQLAAAEILLKVPLVDLVKRLAEYGVIRLTYQPSELRVLHPLALDYERRDGHGGIVDHFNAPVFVEWIDVALMPQHVGFLSLKMRIDETGTEVNRLNDFLYYARQIHKQTVDWQLPKWKHVGDSEYEFTSRDLVDFLLQGLTETQSSSPHIINNFADWISQEGSVQRYSLTDRGQVYGQTFRLYTYACLEETKNPAAEPSPDMTSAREEDIKGQFDSPTARTLYELATCTRTDDDDYMPHPVALKEIMEKGRIAFWMNWEAMALHDNVVFLAAGPSSFTSNVLPHNVEFDYFHLYLLTLYQKTRLSMFSAELMRHEGTLLENLKDARQLWEAFSMFRNHYWFAEITFKPQGTELYKRFQAGLNAIAVYNAISNEVYELQRFYERRSDQDMSDATLKMQAGMAKNVEQTRQLQESTNEAVVAARDIAGRQLTLTTVLQQNLAATNKLQVKVEWIEIFIVAFYTSELLHIMISLFEEKYHFELWWSSTLVLGSGLLVALIAWLLLRPDRHSEVKPALKENGTKV